MANASLTWLGHASFRLDTAGGKRIYVDPFLSGNPKCPDSEKEPERIDVIAVTHGHGDHVGGTVEAAGCKFTLVNAFHSSSSNDGAYLGEAAGIVLELDEGGSLYFAGDT